MSTNSTAGGPTVDAEGGAPTVTEAQQLSNQPGGDVGFRYLMADAAERARFISNSGAEFIGNDSALEYDEWRRISDTTIRVREQQLQLVSALRNAGLTKDLGLETYVDLWNTVTDIDGADVTMNPGDATDEDDVATGMDGAPLPVIQKNWSINRRKLLASRSQGTALDTLVPAQMTREIASTVERIFINGWAPSVNGYEMYGFRNHPDRNTVAGNTWDDDSTDAKDIRDDVLALIEALENDEFGAGDYWMVVNRSSYQDLRATVDDLGQGEVNMLTRLQEEFSADLGDFYVSPHLPDGEAFLFAPTEECVTVGVAEDIQPIQWSSPSGFTIHMKHMGAMNLELRSTEAGQMGVAHITGI
jgi:uncharacterized linocin/CFP29 family protein